MAGCYFYLSRHPEAYARARNEIRSTFATLQEIRTGQKLSSCVYLRVCIEESLRLSPPVGGALWREVAKGGLSIDGYHIPAGYDVGVGIYAVHHNPRYFPSPYSYRPERWMEGEGTNKEAVELAKSAFSAFSIGPVGCLGKNLAYMEMMLAIAHTLWALDMESEAGPLAPVPSRSYLRRYRAHAEGEYRLRDRFTSWKEGPWLTFRVRENV